MTNYRIGPNAYDYYLTKEENKYIKNLTPDNNYSNYHLVNGKAIKETIQAVYDLPAQTQKSFYGKAKIIETEKGRYLLSYETIVCFLSYGGTFVKFWPDYSVTTMKHINDFMYFVRWNVGGKKWWESLSCNTDYRYNDFVS